MEGEEEAEAEGEAEPELLASADAVLVTGPTIGSELAPSSLPERPSPSALLPSALLPSALEAERDEPREADGAKPRPSSAGWR